MVAIWSRFEDMVKETCLNEILKVFEAIMHAYSVLEYVEMRGVYDRGGEEAVKVARGPGNACDFTLF